MCKLNELLAICIPTYNRVSHLRECIEKLIPQLSQYNNPIYISDNNSEDATTVVVQELQNTYPFIFYSKNAQNMGPDYNFIHVLKMAPTKYAWLLGDDDRIGEGVIDRIMSELSNAPEYDAVVVNGGLLNGEINGRVTGLPSKIYYDQNLLLRELGWHMTWMSCSIFNRRIFEEDSYERYFDTNFLQFAIMFDFFANKKICVSWISDGCIYGASTEKAAWRRQTFKIFVKRWYDVVQSLPDYKQDAKNKCIISHAEKTGLFSLYQLIILREENNFNFAIFKEYVTYFHKVVKTSVVLLFFISIVPKQTIPIVRSVKKKIIPNYNIVS